MDCPKCGETSLDPVTIDNGAVYFVEGIVDAVRVLKHRLYFSPVGEPLLPGHVEYVLTPVPDLSAGRGGETQYQPGYGGLATPALADQGDKRWFISRKRERDVVYCTDLASAHEASARHKDFAQIGQL